METSSQAPVALTIAGSDSGANAGIQADLLAFSANGVFGTTALTCITAQNPSGVSDIQPLFPEIVASQIKQVADYFHPKAIKTGMLYSSDIIDTVCDALAPLKTSAKIVVDPVMLASSGSRLLDETAVTQIKEKLLPLADLITPNLDEAKILASVPLKTLTDIEHAAQMLADRYQSAVLLKGGHLPGDDLVDTLALPDGQIKTYHQTRIPDIDTHGSGCTLSAAITAWFAKDAAFEEAVSKGRDYLRSAMEHPVFLGDKSFINHSPQK